VLVVDADPVAGQALLETLEQEDEMPINIPSN